MPQQQGITLHLKHLKKICSAFCRSPYVVNNFKLQYPQYHFLSLKKLVKYYMTPPGNIILRIYICLIHNSMQVEELRHKDKWHTKSHLVVQSTPQKRPCPMGSYQCRAAMSISTYELGTSIKVFLVWTLGRNMSIQILLKWTYQVGLYMNLHVLGVWRGLGFRVQGGGSCVSTNVVHVRMVQDLYSVQNVNFIMKFIYILCKCLIFIYVLYICKT